MSNSSVWIIFFAALWVGSSFYFYEMGWLRGNTAANLALAQTFAQRR